MRWGRDRLSPTRLPRYVLENLNRFLKHRESWRGYSLTSTETAVKASFEGPPAAPLMEYDYRPIDPRQFERVLPSPKAAVPNPHRSMATHHAEFSRASSRRLATAPVRRSSSILRSTVSVSPRLPVLPVTQCAYSSVYRA